MARFRCVLAVLLGLSCLSLTGCPAIRYDVIALSQNSYDFGLNDMPWAFQVWNSDPSILPSMSFVVSTDQPWLTCDPESGTSTGSSGPGGKKVITVTVNRSGLSAGQHKGTITISGNRLVSKRLQITLTSEGSTNGSGGWTLRNIVADYAPPYLLEYSFSLSDENGHSVIAEPAQFQVTCKEDGKIIGSETVFQFVKGANKQLLTYLVLDYTFSMADIEINGDADGNGRSDAIDAMEAAAKDVFLDALSQDAQVGIYEFHREDPPFMKVADFTTDREYLKSRIDAIWTEYVRGLSGATRCWDALFAATREFSNDADARKDEQRAIVFLSDGRDESSTHSYQEAIDSANERGIAFYCIGFGAELDLTALQVITSQTSGQYYSASTVEELGERFQQIITDLGGQYILRWATLKRTAQASFLPSFTLELAGDSLDYAAPSSAVYNPVDHAGNPLLGELRMAISSSADATTAFLRATYVPRYITRLSLRAESAHSFAVSLVSATEGGLCDDAEWNLTVSDDPEGGKRILVESAAPDNIYTAIPYAAFGSILKFDFDVAITDPASAFSALEVDNTIYDGGQSFDIDWPPAP